MGHTNTHGREVPLAWTFGPRRRHGWHALLSWGEGIEREGGAWKGDPSLCPLLALPPVSNVGRDGSQGMAAAVAAAAAAAASRLHWAERGEAIHAFISYRV